MAAGGERTEEATEKRKRDSRKRGQVARSQDLSSVLVLLGVIGLVVTVGLWALPTLYFYWQWFHYTRQSYGVGQIYRRKAADAAVPNAAVTKAAIYLLPLAGILYRSSQGPEEFLGLELRVIPVPAPLLYAALAAAGVALIWWSAVQLRAYWQGRMLLGADYVKASRCARVCLNVIDPGNYPAANMRFFENFAAGGATLNSACPEMADQFPDGVATRYYATVEELVTTARGLVRDHELRARIAECGSRSVWEQHTYRHRAEDLLEALAR